MIGSEPLVCQLILENFDHPITHQKMASKIEPTVLDGLKCVVWVTNMDTLLKSKGL